MLKRSIVAAAFALAACGGSSGPATHFGATMNGANEVPAKTTAATGTATYVINATSVDYTVTWTGLSGNATAGHIHVGTPDVAGAVVVPFTLSAAQKAPQGTLSGTFTAADVQAATGGTVSVAKNDFDGLIAAMRAGNTYTNVHTAANPGGEIRGTNTAQ
jgi:CHRD domain